MHPLAQPDRLERHLGPPLSDLAWHPSVDHGQHDVVERVHPRLYEAYFTKSLDIADPRVVADIVAAEGVDMTRFNADLESGAGREAVVKDYEAAVAEGVRSIPTVIVPETGRALVGLVDATMYRAAVEEAAG